MLIKSQTFLYDVTRSGKSDFMHRDAFSKIQSDFSGSSPTPTLIFHRQGSWIYSGFMVGPFPFLSNHFIYKFETEWNVNIFFRVRNLWCFDKSTENLKVEIIVYKRKNTFTHFHFLNTNKEIITKVKEWHDIFQFWIIWNSLCFS